MRRVGMCLALFLGTAAGGCGAHLHRPFDAATAEQAATELKDAKLTDGFAPELEQAATMLEEELAVARAWAQQGRDRDLLDVLSATAIDEHDPDAEILLHPSCRGRYKGDGWTMLCSKLARRLASVGGFTPPGPPTPEPKPPRGRPAVPVTPVPDAWMLLSGKLRGMAVQWRGPNSDEGRLAQVTTELGLRARSRDPSGTMAAAIASPRCPTRPVATRDAVLTEVTARHTAACATRRANLLALQSTAGGELGAQASRALVVFDALAVHDAELARRLAVYDAARRPCIGDPTTREPCDPQRVQAAFAGLGEIPAGPVLMTAGYEVLAREGRVLQLAAQLAALDRLIETREIDRKVDASAGTKVGDTTPLALALHQTIEGIERVKAVTDAFEMAVLALIRETLRVEHAALVTATRHAERRRRLELARLTAQLDEAALLVEAFARLQKLSASGCTEKPLLQVQAQESCRDDTTRVLQALSNAWTLGRAAQRQAEVLELAVRHEASIDRSRAAMAMREVHLAAGVAELVKFNKGGIQPELLALLIVNAVGFGIVAGGVY